MVVDLLYKNIFSIFSYSLRTTVLQHMKDVAADELISAYREGIFWHLKFLEGKHHLHLSPI